MEAELRSRDDDVKQRDQALGLIKGQLKEALSTADGHCETIQRGVTLVIECLFDSWRALLSLHIQCIVFSKALSIAWTWPSLELRSSQTNLEYKLKAVTSAREESEASLQGLQVGCIIGCFNHFRCYSWIVGAPLSHCRTECSKHAACFLKSNLTGLKIGKRLVTFHAFSITPVSLFLFYPLLIGQIESLNEQLVTAVAEAEAGKQAVAKLSLLNQSATEVVCSCALAIHSLVWIATCRGSERSFGAEEQNRDARDQKCENGSFIST